MTVVAPKNLISFDERALLRAVILNGDLTDMRGLFDKHGAALWQVSPSDTAGNMSALFYAVEFGICAAIAFMLDHGARIDSVRAITEETPLFVAVRKRSPDIVTLLIEKGASLHDRAKTRKAILHAVLENRKHGKEVFHLLIAAGADLEARQAGDMTPLCMAAALGYEDMVPLLLDAGADADARTLEGKTPLQLAENVQSQKTVAVLTAYLEKKSERQQTVLCQTRLKDYAPKLTLKRRTP